MGFYFSRDDFEDEIGMEHACVIPSEKQEHGIIFSSDIVISTAGFRPVGKNP